MRRPVPPTLLRQGISGVVTSNRGADQRVVVPARLLAITLGDEIRRVIAVRRQQKKGDRHGQPVPADDHQ